MVVVSMPVGRDHGLLTTICLNGLALFNFVQFCSICLSIRAGTRSSIKKEMARWLIAQ